MLQAGLEKTTSVACVELYLNAVNLYSSLAKKLILLGSAVPTTWFTKKLAVKGLKTNLDRFASAISTSPSGHMALLDKSSVIASTPIVQVLPF